MISILLIALLGQTGVCKPGVVCNASRYTANTPYQLLADGGVPRRSDGGVINPNSALTVNTDIPTTTAVGINQTSLPPCPGIGASTMYYVKDVGCYFTCGLAGWQNMCGTVGDGGISQVTASAPITSTGGATPVIGCTHTNAGAGGCDMSGLYVSSLTEEHTTFIDTVLRPLKEESWSGVSPLVYQSDLATGSGSTDYQFTPANERDTTNFVWALTSSDGGNGFGCAFNRDTPGDGFHYCESRQFIAGSADTQRMHAAYVLSGASSSVFGTCTDVGNGCNMPLMACVLPNNAHHGEFARTANQCTAGADAGWFLEDSAPCGLVRNTDGAGVDKGDGTCNIGYKTLKGDQWWLGATINPLVTASLPTCQANNDETVAPGALTNLIVSGSDQGLNRCMIDGGWEEVSTIYNGIAGGSMSAYYDGPNVASQGGSFPGRRVLAKPTVLNSKSRCSLYVQHTGNGAGNVTVALEDGNLTQWCATTISCSLAFNSVATWGCDAGTIPIGSTQYEFVDTSACNQNPGLSIDCNW